MIRKAVFRELITEKVNRRPARFVLVDGAKTGLWKCGVLLPDQKEAGEKMC